MNGKKIKNAAEKITMPEDMKERIISACENSTEKNIKSDRTEYAEHVSGVETINSSRRILRIVSGIAACAVIVGGAGTALHLVNRNGSSSVPSTQVANTEEINEGSPFMELLSKDFSMALPPEADLTQEMRTQIADFLNSQEWTETDDYDHNRHGELGTWGMSSSNNMIICYVDETDNYYLSICSDNIVQYCHFNNDENGDPINVEQKFYKVDDQNYLIENIFDIIWSSSSPFGSFSDYDLESQYKTAYGIDTLTPMQRASLGNYFNSIEMKEFEGLDEMKELEGLGSDPSEWGKVPYLFLSDDGIRSIAVYDSNILIYTPDRNISSDEKNSSLKCYRIDSEKVISSINAILETGSSDDPTEEEAEELIQSIRDEMTNYLTSDEYSCTYSYYSAGISGDGAAQELTANSYAMNSGMRHGLAGWLSKNPPEIGNTPTGGNILFDIEISKGSEGAATLTFFTQDFLMFTVTDKNDPDHEHSYLFTTDSQAAKDIIEAALDTEIKHTEDNAAYYMPGFNFTKMGAKIVTEDGDVPLTEEQNTQLQNVFYGYDWEAHEVQDVPDSELVAVFAFKASIGGANGNYDRLLIVCENGYIYLLDRDKNGEQVHTDDEHIYKFSNTDIEDGIREILG